MQEDWSVDHTTVVYVESDHCRFQLASDLKNCAEAEELE